MCELRTWGQTVIDNTITSEIMRMYTTNQDRGVVSVGERFKKREGENLVIQGRSINNYCFTNRDSVG